MMKLRNKVTGEVFQINPAYARLRRLQKRIFAWIEVINELGLYGKKYRQVMITLTYRKAEDWKRNQIRDYMLSLRKSLGSKIKAYAWVAEMQKRGVIHYHVIIVVNKGTKIAMPDKDGSWLHGMTRIETVKTMYYIAAYTGKEVQKLGAYPKGCRIFSVWVHKSIADRLHLLKIRVSTLPAWIRAQINLIGMEAVRIINREKGGYNLNDIQYLSPYEYLPE